MKSAKYLAAAGVASVLVTAGGCSWFRGDKSDETRPVAETNVYRSPERGGRIGDYRRDGVLDATQQADRDVPANGSAATSGASPVRIVAGGRAPAATRPVVAKPEYLVLGSVVANVNGTAIYGHELVKLVAPLLRARARELDEPHFKQVAQAELKRQRENLIRDELEYAAAQRNTTADEVKEAQGRTFMYRERLVSQAGGSLEMARSIARDQGEDFDRLLKREERRQLVGLYYRKKIFPRVVVTVDEMRRYYEQNRDRQFTVPAQATVRVIRIDPKEVGSESAAIERANEAQRRAAAGEPFERLSDEYNKMPMLVQNKGTLGPLSQGSYAIAEVDAAIWKTDAGQTTPVIRAPNALYVLQVAEKHPGRVSAFDEPDVQAAINAALREQKMVELQQKARDALQKDAVIQADDAMLQPVVEMAMQMYADWKADAPTPLLR